MHFNVLGFQRETFSDHFGMKIHVPIQLKEVKKSNTEVFGEMVLGFCRDFFEALYKTLQLQC